MDRTVEIDRLIGDAKLPSPSPVVLALYDALESGGAEELGRIIESEPALAARLLRIASSAFYGATPVATVHEAVVKVGTTEVAGLVLSTEIISIQKLNVTTDTQLGVVAERYGLDPLADGGYR